MDTFDGFPDGDLKFTQIPDLFFSKLLPQIDDVRELKVTLHFMWVHQREKKRAISLAELRTDETLILGLAAVNDEPRSALQQGLSALQQGLDLAVKRKTLRYAQLKNDEGEHDLYFLNSTRGRQAFQEYQTGKFGVVSVTDVDVVSPHALRPNIFKLYEANISLIGPIIAERLKDAQKTYPDEWIEKAIKEAVENNARTWRYIRAILKRWESEGPNYETNQRTSKTDSSKRWFTDEEFERFFEQ